MLDFFDWSYWLGVALRRLKWPLMLLFYIAVIGGAKLYGLFLLGSFMGTAMFALHLDKEREKQGADDFWGEMLFFRYGQNIERTWFPIPVKPEWSAEKTAQFADSMRESLAEALRANIPADCSQVVDTAITEGVITIVEKKVFLKIVARSRRGSQLTHFVHYAPFGGTLTAHYFTYLRGKYHDWDVVKFIVASPFTMWFWGVPWLLNRLSLSAELSHFRDSSFDTLDLQTMLTMTHYLLWKKTEELLREADLLTQELMQVINNNVSQSISVNGSSHVQFGSVMQQVPAAPPIRKAA